MRLILLNGWAASSKVLERFEKHLPSHYDLYVLDAFYQFELASIVAKIDALVTEDSILLGWSLGGMLSLYYASLNEEVKQPKAFILLNSSACFIEKDDLSTGVKRAEFNGLKQMVTNEETSSLLRLFSHLMVDASSGLKQDRRLLKQIFTAESLPNWEALAKGLEYLESFDLREALGSINQPVLSVLGEKDVLVNAPCTAKLLEKNTHFKVNIIEGMGHFPFGVFAQKITEIIVNYASTVDESRVKGTNHEQ